MNDERDRRAREVGAEIDELDRAMRRRWIRRRIGYWSLAGVGLALLGGVAGLLLGGVDGMLSLGGLGLVIGLFGAVLNLGFEFYMSRDAW